MNRIQQTRLSRFFAVAALSAPLLVGGCEENASQNPAVPLQAAEKEAFRYVTPLPQGGANEVYVARLTEARQCEDVATDLASAVNDLRLHNPTYEVVQSSVGRLNDRMFCAACGCPTGSYYIAKLRSDATHFDYVGWEVIDASNIRKTAAVAQQSQSDAE